MTAAELKALRAPAGARYAAAVAELKAAFIDMYGIDLALQSNRPDVASPDPVFTFCDPPQNIGRLAHPVYSPVERVIDWVLEATKRRDSLLASLPKI